MKEPVPRDNEFDPQIREFIEYLVQRSAEYQLDNGLSLAEKRRLAEKIREPLTFGGPVFEETREHVVDDRGRHVRVRIINASPETACPALVYLHGGGWMFFSIDTHDRIMRELAAQAGIAVVGIDYSLSPDVRFPTQLGEIRAVVSWLRETGGDLGVDADRLFVGGDSAGANLSVATCLSLRDAGELDGVRGMLLFYGVYDAAMNTPSYSRYADPGYVLSRDEMREFWSSYTRGPDDFGNPLVSPLQANLVRLPPAMMIVAERDVLHDENQEMIRKLQAAGVDVQARVYPGTVHSFLEAVSMADISRQALADSAAWLRKRIDGD